MTTLHAADLHLSANPRDQYRFHFLEEWLPRAIEKYNVARVIINGDVTEVKDGHPAPLVNRVVDDFARIAEVADLIINRGNHDYSRADTPFWRFLAHIPRVRWINEPTIIKLRGLGRCMFLPHTASWERDWEGLDFGADYIFAHQTFAGAVSESGREMNGVPRDVFPRGTQVVSGDVHVPQKVGCVTYSGAPYRVDFGDDFEPRVLLLNGHEMCSVPVEGPQKRLVGASISGLAARNGELKITYSDNWERGDVVKVNLSFPANADVPRAAARAAVKDWATEAGVELYAVQVVAPKPAQTEKTAAKRDRRTDADLVRAHVKKLRKGKITLALGLKLTKEVA